MAIPTRPIHTSSSGDSWYLCRTGDGEVAVVHEPSEASGGKPSRVDLGTFLAKENRGPEHQSLRKLIGELVDTNSVMAEYDDHD